MEQGLQFAGFIAFECKIRADSGIVMRSLIESDHRVSMLTGDALLTSLHVAKQVSICDKTKDTLTLYSGEVVLDPHSTTVQSSSVEAAAVGPYWVRRNQEGNEDRLPFSVETLPALGRQYDLLTTEVELLRVIGTAGEKSPVWNHVGHFKVFARMSPGGKASIIRAIQQSNKDTHVLMCGDGGNDVGALKQVSR